MPSFLGSPKVQYFQTGTSEFLTGGKLYSYVAGTTTPKATYPTIADAEARTNANTNPLILDSRGEATVVLDGNTKFVLTDANDVLIWSVDEVGGTSTDILDANGNELLKFVTTNNAFNEWTITNAATGNKPSFAATGSDANVGGQITTKGSGDLLLDGGGTGGVSINSISTGPITLTRATTCGSNLAVTGTLAVTSTSAFTGAVTSGAVTVNTSLTTAATATTSFLPAGTVIWKASTNVPTGWLECNGAAVSRTTYAALFSDIGTTFGTGDGSTTFNLPTQARRTLVGRGGSGTATLANTVGATGGSETHTLTAAEMPTHSHTYLAPQAFSINPGGGGAINVGAATGTNTTSATTGGSDAHNNMQPSLVMMMIIRAY